MAANPTRPWRGLYDRAEWKRLREAQLEAHPLCCMCLESEIVTPATVADHVRPHRGDESLFFDAGNLQSLCKRHHDRDKALIERGRAPVRFGPDGWPLDPARQP